MAFMAEEKSPMQKSSCLFAAKLFDKLKCNRKLYEKERKISYVKGC